MTFTVSITKMGVVITSLVSALALASPVQAIGLTFNWSFNATYKAGNAATLGTVSGTISGVQDNTTSNNNSGLIATVLRTPDGQNQGVSFGGVSLTLGDITVVNGVVTSSVLLFQGSNFGFSHFFHLRTDNSIYSIDPPFYYLANFDNGATFSPATPVPFEFDPSFGLVALGGIWAGRKVIKKIKTGKKSV